jgi:GGDEF domain-containing protein
LRHSVPLLAADVDHFEKINDTHGHVIGDRVLLKIAQVLRSHIRSDDIASRPGGDEFATRLDGSEPAAQVSLSIKFRRFQCTTPYSSPHRPVLHGRPTPRRRSIAAWAADDLNVMCDVDGGTTLWASTRATTSFALSAAAPGASTSASCMFTSCCACSPPRRPSDKWRTAFAATAAACVAPV